MHDELLFRTSVATSQILREIRAGNASSAFFPTMTFDPLPRTPRRPSSGHDDRDHDHDHDRQRAPAPHVPLLRFPNMTMTMTMTMTDNARRRPTGRCCVFQT
jgi:hypothetical protein